MNSVNITGNLGKDPELKQTPNGKSVCSFGLAVKDRENTHWIDVVAWGSVAENLCQYQRKGAKIGVTGRLQTREWTDKDGGKRRVTEVVAEKAEWLDSKPKTADVAPDGPPASGEDFAELDNDGDLPF